MVIPRLVIAATRSGEGKTTFALGLMAALRARGLVVQGFKVGPDYLDTGYQLLACGKAGRNLDLWMMGESAVRRSVSEHGGAADISIIEGVMGLFDGHRDGVTPTSTADTARSLGAPVFLVLDASRLSGTAGAIALGCQAFDPDLQIAGVILNRWNDSRSITAVQKAMDRARIPILGCIPPAPNLSLPSRHLGLVVADELRGQAEGVLKQLGELVAAHTDLDRVLQIARAAGDLFLPSHSSVPASNSSASASHSSASASHTPAVRIGVARDEAFAFYYPENIELLEEAGATIHYFSPMSHERLPDVDSLYLGGGYPELHAEHLAANLSMRESIRGAIMAGLPTYAECGGLLYLCQSLVDLDGRAWPMAGALPTVGRMHGKLQRMGYREGVTLVDSLLGPPGTKLRGHEFHYSSCESVEDVSNGFDPDEDGRGAVARTATSPGSAAAYLLDGKLEGCCTGSLFASYAHLHFAGCPEVASRWVSRALRFSRLECMASSAGLCACDRR